LVGFYQLGQIIYWVAKSFGHPNIKTGNIYLISYLYTVRNRSKTCEDPLTAKLKLRRYSWVPDPPVGALTVIVPSLAALQVTSVLATNAVGGVVAVIVLDLFVTHLLASVILHYRYQAVKQ
jgi:hypothetical protein